MRNIDFHPAHFPYGEQGPAGTAGVSAQFAPFTAYLRICKSDDEITLCGWQAKAEGGGGVGGGAAIQETDIFGDEI